MAKVFDIGDTVQLKCEFRNTTDVLTDPSVVKLQVLTPPATESSPTAVSTVTGIWTYDLVLTVAGFYYYRFAGTGAVGAAAESKFQVRASAFSVP